MKPPLDVIDVALLVRRLGGELAEIRYDRQAFGGWSITWKGDKAFVRLVWDGKDGILVIQAPSDRARSEWRDIWIGREAAEQTLESLEHRLTQ